MIATLDSGLPHMGGGKPGGFPVAGEHRAAAAAEFPNWPRPD